MDRTIIGPRKAEEKELSEKLFKKLQGLALLSPPTEEFRKCISEEMFLKSNPQAFFQCMHFLFRLIDPVEFKKRFFWPITDKRSEANFRATTVEYLKHLNEKHQLQWTNIKSYLVVMPGGMKFITFMLDLVGFVILELTRQREKQLGSKFIEQVSDVNLKRMRRQNEFFKEYAAAYSSEVDTQTAKLLEKIQHLAKQMEVMAQIAGLDIALLNQDLFYTEFAATNQSLFRQKFCERSDNIKQLEQPLHDLRAVTEKFMSKEAACINYDKDTVQRTLRQIDEMFPARQTKLNNEESFVSPGISSLIVAFNSVHGKIESALSAADQKPRAGQFVEQELAKLLAELQPIETQITDFQKMLNEIAAEKRSNAEHKDCPPPLPQTPLHGIGGGGGGYSAGGNDKRVSRLLEKYVCTPPIKFEMPESSRMANTRLPLVEDFQHTMTLESFHNFPAMPPQSVRKPKLESSFLDLNNTAVNKSRIIDPITLLRTIKKGTTTKPRTTPQLQLCSKWKERQNLFGSELNAIVPSLLATPNCTAYGAEESITPFNAHENTLISRSQLLMHDISSSASANASGTTLLYGKKLSAVKKVQDASLNLHNLSSSPTGRLEALVNIGDLGGLGGSSSSSGIIYTPPKVCLNDCTLLNDDDVIEQNVMLQNCIDSAADVMKALNIIEESYKNVENDRNIANVRCDFPLALCLDENQEELFNMSDSVLKDITK